MTDNRTYQLHLKGFVGGYDFDADYVDYILGKNKDNDRQEYRSFVLEKKVFHSKSSLPVIVLLIDGFFKVSNQFVKFCIKIRV